MTDLVALKTANAKRWDKAHLTRSFSSVAARLIAPNAKGRYQTVEAKTGVPWYFIAVAHEREASQNFNTQLGQGDPLHSVSVHIPAGRGPFNSWEDGAVDALVNCAPHAARNTDWSIGGLLTMLEGYNGFGYFSRSLPSPYIWAGTDQYKSGKFVRDGVFDPNAIDQQLGCAGLLMTMVAIDPSIKIGEPKPPIIVPPVTAPAPSVTTSAPNSISAFIASIFAAIFKRK